MLILAICQMDCCQYKSCAAMQRINQALVLHNPYAPLFLYFLYRPAMAAVVPIMLIARDVLKKLELLDDVAHCDSTYMFDSTNTWRS
jgi:hypothetical protein